MMHVLQTYYRVCIALFIIGIVTYATSFANQFVWDDEQFIYNNTYVKTFAVEDIFTSNTIAGAGESSNYYRPLTTLSFAIDHFIWGLQPFGFHLTNTLLHVLSGVLLFIYLKQLKFSDTASFVISCLFIVHPVQTEAVTYVNSRGDSLYSFFLFAGLVSYSYLLHQIEYKSGSRQGSLLQICAYGTIAWVCYILSILSKEIGIAGIGLFGLTFVYVRWLQYSAHHKLWEFTRSFIWKSHGWFVLYLQAPVTIGYLVLRSTVLNFTGSLNQYEGTEYGSSLFIRLLTFSKIFLEYIGLLLWPHPLYMDRQPQVITSLASPYPWICLVVLTIIGGIGWWSWKNYRQPVLLFGLAWFIGMLVPVSGVIGINGMMYEHWLYVPQVGFWLIVLGLWQVMCCGNYAKRIITATSRKLFILFHYQIRINHLLFAFCLIGCITLTMLQNYYWSTPIRLYNHLLQYTQTARIHNNLAMAYTNNKEYGQAVVHYQQAIQIDPNYPQTYHNLANTYQQQGQLEEAKKYYLKALEVMPTFYWSRSNLVIMFIKEKNYSAALEHLRYLKQQFPGELSFIQQEQVILEQMSSSDQ